MSALRLHLHPDPVLRAICAPVEAFDGRLRGLADAMLELMYAAPGRGLVGPQVGVTERVFVMDATWKEGAPAPQVMVNPVVAWAPDETEIGEEGCLSIPEVPCRVRRPLEIRLSWRAVDGAPREAAFKGVAARIALHELDHLDGVVCIDRAEGLV